MALYILCALGYIFCVGRTGLTQLKFKYRTKKEILYEKNLYQKTSKQLMKFNNDNTGKKLNCVRKTTTFSRLQLQKLTLRCKVDRKQLSENLLPPGSLINFRPGTGDNSFPGNASTCLSNTVLHSGRPKF